MLKWKGMIQMPKPSVHHVISSKLCERCMEHGVRMIIICTNRYRARRHTHKHSTVTYVGTGSASS